MGIWLMDSRRRCPTRIATEQMEKAKGEDARSTAELNAVLVKRNVKGIITEFDFEKRELNVARLKTLKNILRRDESMVDVLWETVMAWLSRHGGDADSRLALLFLVDHFFMRCHRFRLIVVDTLQDFLIYTAETDPLHFPLPFSSKGAAIRLKTETLKIIRRWHDEYAGAYEKLRLSYQFLKNSKSLDFERADAETLAERVRVREEEERKNRLSHILTGKVENEFVDREKDIEKCLIEARNAIKLIMPDFGIDGHVASISSSTSSNNNLHALDPSKSVAIRLNLQEPLIRLSNDNEALMQTLIDIRKLLDYYRRLLAKWLSKLSIFGGNERLTKQLIAKKAEIAMELDRMIELNLPESTKGNKQQQQQQQHDEEEDSDDEMEDVQEKEGLELDFDSKAIEIDNPPRHILNRIEILKAMEQQGNVLQQKTQRSIATNDSGMEQQGNDSQQMTAPSIATNDSITEEPDVPTVAFGLDLKYWGQKDVRPAEIPKNNAGCHRFWRPPDEQDSRPEQDDVYQCRVMTFIGQNQPVLRECRYPMTSGGLCPRKDRYRCPIHGIIVDRNVEGVEQCQPGTSTVAAAREENRRLSLMRSNPSALGDEEYLLDVEQQIGMKLTVAKDKKKRRTRESTVGKQSRDRLTNKLFDRRTIKRVSATLDAMQKARSQRKFAAQFTNALSRA